MVLFFLNQGARTDGRYKQKKLNRNGISRPPQFMGKMHFNCFKWSKNNRILGLLSMHVTRKAADGFHSAMSAEKERHKMKGPFLEKKKFKNFLYFLVLPAKPALFDPRLL